MTGSGRGRPRRPAAGARLAVLVTSAGLVLSCTGPSPTPGPDRAPSPGPTPTADPNTVVWAVGQGPATLDAARLAADADVQIAAQVYDRLVRLRPGTADLAPGIAADWDADTEGRTFTFKLRDGLRFHDGTPLDASAVVWNVERWMNPSHPAHQGEFQAWRSYFGGFVGEEDAQGRDLNLVAKVEALDARTVRFRLNAPFTPFLHNLAMVPFGLSSPTAVSAQGEDYGADGAHLPVGSGPLAVTGWSPDGTVALAPFADYWAKPAAAPGVRFVVISDVGRRAQAVADGAVHGADLPATLPITGSLTAPGVLVVPRPPSDTAWLMLNHSRTPLGDARVRRALSLAIDRETLARDHFGSAALPAGQLLPPGFLGHDDAIAPPARDVEGAKALLAEAGAGEGMKLILWVPNTDRDYLPDPLGAAEAVAANLREVGIDASVRSEGLRQFLADRDTGRFTAWIIGWRAQSTDPDNFWFWHFGAGRTASEGQYDNPELTLALRNAQRLVGTAQRAELYGLAARIVATDTARVFLAHTRPLVAVSTRIEGYEPGPLGFDDLAAVSLRPAPAGATVQPAPTGDATAAPAQPPGSIAPGGPGTPAAAPPETPTGGTEPPAPGTAPPASASPSTPGP